MNLSQLDFQQLRVKHFLFKSKVRSVLYGGVMDPTFFSLDQGPIGEWISTKGLPRYGHYFEMKELERMHRQLHDEVHSLFLMYKRGKIEEARDGLKRVEERSERFLQNLERLEQAAMQG